MSEPRSIELHGQSVTYHLAGEGPVVLLVHGITSSSQTWSSVFPLLAEHHTVLAPDLLGHGRSAKPRGDYSLGAYASGLRDLLLALDLSPATVVGHSLGGGVAMQFAYQFPDLIDRLVLVGSGGLGQEVNLLLRAATLPGAEVVLPLVNAPLVRLAGATAGFVLDRVGYQRGADMRGIAEGFVSLRDREARRAFIHTARSVMDPRGQRVDARDRLYLAAETPSLLVWGEDDAIIPVSHARSAHELMPGSRLEVFPDAGHFPFNVDPERFARVLSDFVATTAPAAPDTGRVQRLLQGRLRAGEQDPGPIVVLPG